MKKSDEIRKMMDDLSTEAEALHNLAERESRDLTEEEQERWNAIMDKEDGELANLDVQLKEAQKREEEVARLRASRQSLSAPAQEFDEASGQNGGAAVPLHVRLVNPTLKAFKGNGNKEQALRDAYDCGLWFKSLFLRTRHPEAAQASRDKLIARRGADWYATQNETTPTDGGYLVPPQFENAVISYREQVGVARRLARVVQMSSDTWEGIKQTSGTSVYYPGEEGQITASDANFSKFSLAAKKRAIIAYVSSELRDDAVVSVMDFLAEDMGHQFALQEDNEFVNGDGTSSYGGVQGVYPAVVAATASVATAVTGNDLWSELTITDHAAAMSKISDKYRGLPLSWLCSAAYKWQVMDRLALAQGGSPATDIVGGIPQMTFMGYPVVLTDRMPTTTAAATVAALFGAFGNSVIIGNRSGISVVLSEHFKFDTDQIAVRATTRYDIHVHEEGDTSTAGALAGLKTAS